ncbi:MAG: undecaprenyl-diphosphate phosphatase [Oscillospiraceae bacterium]|nr:undecaprenyl-diphosphate phosphatase [Oscillospiraceae bacterium]
MTEFIPVSSRGHQGILRCLFGIETRNSFQELLVHIGVLLSVFIGCREVIARLRREQKILSGSSRKKYKSVDNRNVFDLRLLKTATVPMLLVLLLTIVTRKMDNNLLWIMGFLLINGIVLLLADYTQHGNRDSRTMTGLDGIVIGILGGLSAFPGISRTGFISAYTAARGADGKCILNWSVLLTIPAILFYICLDLAGIFSNGLGVLNFSVFVGYFMSGVAGFLGGYLGISILGVILNHYSFSRFAYYSMGASLFSFILYLIS